MENLIFWILVFVIIFCVNNIAKDWKEMDCSKDYNDYFNYKNDKYNK